MKSSLCFFNITNVICTLVIRKSFFRDDQFSWWATEQTFIQTIHLFLKVPWVSTENVSFEPFSFHPLIWNWTSTSIRCDIYFFHLVWHLNLLGLSYIETKQTRNKGNRLTFICGCFCSNNRANNWMQRVRATLSVGQRVVLIENKHLGHWTAFNRWERQPMI